MSKAWEILCYVICSSVAMAIIVLVTNFIMCEKEFKGYYLQKMGSSGHSIWANWENTSDVRVFSTFDQEKLIRVFILLKKTENE